MRGPGARGLSSLQSAEVQWFGCPSCQGARASEARAARGPCCQCSQGARKTRGPGCPQRACRYFGGPNCQGARDGDPGLSGGPWPGRQGGPCCQHCQGPRVSGARASAEGPCLGCPSFQGPGRPGGLCCRHCQGPGKSGARASEAPAVRGPVTGARTVRDPCYGGWDGARAAGVVRGPGKRGWGAGPPAERRFS